MVFARFFKKGSSQERRAARRLGFLVEEVHRDLPRFSPGNASVKLRRGSCVRYAIPRTSASPRVLWSLLQRTKSEGAQLPNDYLLVCAEELPAGLEHRLRDLAAKFAEEFFEFEGTESQVAVFWEEWGGEAQVEVLRKSLEPLAL